MPRQICSTLKPAGIPLIEGDANYDGDLDGLDLFAFARAFSAQAPEADLDNDGEILSDDLKLFASRFGRVK